MDSPGEIDPLLLANAIKKVPPAPCDDCVNASRCATELLACLTYIEYSNSPRGHYDSAAIRAPTTAIYNRAFSVKQRHVRR